MYLYLTDGSVIRVASVQLSERGEWILYKRHINGVEEFDHILKVLKIIGKD